VKFLQAVRTEVGHVAYGVRALPEIVRFLARDPYRNRLDNMTLNEVTELMKSGRLTIRETERLLRIQHVASRISP
jgi:hypothetical protein